MKKLFIIPALALFMSANPKGVDTSVQMLKPELVPITTKLDSINIKATELKELLRESPI